jgi:phosphosulfolactate synthase (CoM biosynthesis protein A)
LIELCHAHSVEVSTGGFLERVLAHGSEAVERNIRACKELDFDTIESFGRFHQPAAG